MEIPDINLLFSKIKESQKLIEEAMEIAKELDSLQGVYEPNPSDHSWALKKYFDYYSHRDIEEYWTSSSASQVC